MNVCARVKSLMPRRMQSRELNHQRATERLLADVTAGFNDVKNGRVNSEANFRRRFRQ